MLGVDYFLNKFRDQRKESERMIVCAIDMEKSFDVCFLEWRKTKQVYRQNRK